MTGLSELPENYATRIEATYTTTKSNGIVSSNDKDADYDLYRTEVGADGSSVSTATWTFPIYVNAGDNVVFTKGEEKLPENTGKTDEVDGFTQTTSYVIRKQAADQTSPQEIARGSGKIIPADVIRRLTVEERSVVYIEFINHYKPKHSISVWKTDPAGKVIPTGASFELYLADDFDDTTQKPKENAEVIASGTTGENGILSLGKLAEGEYRLLETKAPAGYVLTGSAVKITITETSVSAMLGTSNLQVNVKGDDDWVAEGQADDTHQIRVWKYDMTLNRNEVIRFTNLPTGTKYRIQEIYANHYKADNSADSAGHAPIEKASNISEEGYEISPPLTTNGTVERTAVNNDTISGTITTPNVRYYNQFTNILTAVKAKIKILKTSQTGITPLPGAIFDLYTREGYESTPKKTLQTDLVSSAETGKEGIIDLGKLGDGVYYLVEKSAPKGYIPLQEPVIITVSSGDVTYSQENSSLDDSGDGKTGDFHVGYQLKVTNDAGVSLPATGGPGTSLIYIIGLTLTGIAGTVLLMRRLKRA